MTSPRTQTTEITDLQNAVVGFTLILSGESAMNHSTIQDGGFFSLAGWVTLTLDVGMFIRLFVMGAHDFVELARG